MADRLATSGGKGRTGKSVWSSVPLRQEDLLYPEEEDFIVNNPVHDDICTYLRNALFEAWAAGPGAVVLHDCRVDWGVPASNRSAPTFPSSRTPCAPWDRSDVNVRGGRPGARPLLAVEVTSPTTRNVDLDDKVDLYFAWASRSMPSWIRGEWPGGGLEIRLLGYRRRTGRCVFPACGRTNAAGSGWTRSACGWRPKGMRAVCYDEQGNRQEEYAMAVRDKHVAETRARQAGARRIAETRGRRGGRRPASRGGPAEVRNRELEAELQRLRGGGPPNPAAP